MNIRTKMDYQKISELCEDIYFHSQDFDDALDSEDENECRNICRRIRHTYRSILNRIQAIREREEYAAEHPGRFPEDKGHVALENGESLDNAFR